MEQEGPVGLKKQGIGGVKCLWKAERGRFEGNGAR
jgi:hypothetical protein